MTVSWSTLNSKIILAGRKKEHSCNTHAKLKYTCSWNFVRACSYEPGPAWLSGETHLRGVNINVVSYGEKFVSLPWDSARKYWNECISANQNAPRRTFVPVNRASSPNLRSYRGHFHSISLRSHLTGLTHFPYELEMVFHIK